MVKTNYKSLAKKKLKQLSTEYQRLKDKHELENPDSDYEYEDDEFICSIADLEHLIEDDSYRTKFNISGDFSEDAYCHYKTHHIFKDLNRHDEDIADYEKQIQKLKEKIKISQILKTQTLLDNLHLEWEDLLKYKLLNVYTCRPMQKNKRANYYKVCKEQKEIFLKYRRYC